MKKYPFVVVGAYIRNSKKQILLAKSFKWGDKHYVVPGGKIEEGHSIEHTLKKRD